MQPLAGQDLAHTQPRPMHWLATAAALAAVVAAAALVRPPDATATTGASPQAAPHTAAPDAHDVTFPVDCGPNRLDVVDQLSGDLDGDGTRETAALVRCHSGTGTPPSGIYVLAQPAPGDAASTAPRIVATLLDPAQGLSVQDFALQGGVVSAKLMGYSTRDVPRCCPDVHTAAKWQWKGGKFVRSELPAAASTAGI